MGSNRADDRPRLPSILAGFVRIEHTIFSLPLILAGAWLGAGNRLPTWPTLVWLAIAGTGARTFGMAMNRIFDRDLDALNPRTMGRELPSGRLSLRGAYGVALAGLVAYLLACGMLGPLCLMLSPVPAIPLLFYSLLKRFTPLCHFGIGLCLALAPAGAYVATAGHLPMRADIALLSLFTFAWMSGFDIIYALQDLQSDRQHGVRSLPASLGPGPALWTAAALHMVAAASIYCLWRLLDGRWLSVAALTLTLATLVAAYWPSIPLHRRFFPLSAVASIAGAMVVLFGGRS